MVTYESSLFKYVDKIPQIRFFLKRYNLNEGTAEDEKEYCNREDHINSHTWYTL